MASPKDYNTEKKSKKIRDRGSKASKAKLDSLRKANAKKAATKPTKAKSKSTKAQADSGMTRPTFPKYVSRADEDAASRKKKKKKTGSGQKVISNFR